MIADSDSPVKTFDRAGGEGGQEDEIQTHDINLDGFADAKNAAVRGGLEIEEGSPNMGSGIP